MTSTQAVTVGIDLGTSSLKAVARSAGDGSVLARARCRYPTARPQPGAAEQDPADWERALRTALAELLTAVPAARWAAIGLSAMLPTLVGLDAEREPTAPAITWEDTRGEDAAREARDRLGGEEIYRRTGQWLDGRYLLPMAVALARRVPAVGARLSVVAGAKDHLVRLLTGELMTDPSTATGFGAYALDAGGWDRDLAGDWELPHLCASTTAVPLRAGFAAEFGLRPGLPVVIGAADSVLGALGAGAARTGDIAYLCGTSTAILGLRDGIALDERHRYLVTPTALGGWAAEADLLATGAAVGWLAALFGVDAAQVSTLAYRDVGPHRPVFLPYLAPGEQGVLWDPHLRGALVGLHVGTGRPELARALLTGIVLESARCVALVGDAAAGNGEIFGAGQLMTRNLAQDLADATGRPVRFDPGEPAHSAVGAAMLAAAAVGLPAARTALRDVRVVPRPAAAAQWAELFEHHERVRHSVGSVANGDLDDR